MDKVVAVIEETKEQQEANWLNIHRRKADIRAAVVEYPEDSPAIPQEELHCPIK